MAGNGAGGRPREGEKVKLSPLNLRTSPDLREKIEEAADVNGRSLTQEVERRLITSFIFDEVRGGPHIAAFANMLASTIQVIENRYEAKWIDDVETFTAVQAAVDRLLRWNRPRTAVDDALKEIGERVREAQKHHDAARRALDEFRRSLGMQSIGGVAYDQPTKSTGKGGFFGGGHVWIDARANWTDEQKQEEERLMAAEQAASQDVSRVSADLSAILDPEVERRRGAREYGEAEAQAMFSLIGPREKPNKA